MDSSDKRIELLDAYKRICRDRGAVLPVSPAYYQWFIDLSDDDMSELIRLIILDRADEINSWIFAVPRTKTEQDIYDYVAKQLHLLALGYIQFDRDGSLGCFAPLGPDPTPAEERGIDLRIRSSRPLFRPTFIRVLQDGNDDHSSKGE